ncbi:MAG: TIGR01777 family oxidoreductase [Flavobacteriales bacterium]|jgi:uncharacterized protein (TIGR01777 family)|nr:TIGR01777 family oxidoreductase [Flavobacteriales bacterium]
MKVLITGGSGLIGSRLTELLLANNIEVVHLTRSAHSKFGIKTYEWDWKQKKIDENCFQGVTDIVHLAGAGIADKPWTMRRKHEIIQSRVNTAKLLFDKVKELQIPIKSYISASGIGYYGAVNSDKVFSEQDQPHDDFIAKSCVYWENSADLFQEIGARVVKLRTGVVLAKDKGALAKMDKTVKLGIGAPIGTGKQAVPWIHIHDIANLYYQVLQNKEYKGVYNAVAPEFADNEMLTKTIAKTLNKKMFLPNVPGFVLRTIYGELSDVVLKGSAVSAEKLLKSGFEFQYPILTDALENIYKK